MMSIKFIEFEYKNEKKKENIISKNWKNVLIKRTYTTLQGTDKISTYSYLFQTLDFRPKCRASFLIADRQRSNKSSKDFFLMKKLIFQVCCNINILVCYIRLHQSMDIYLKGD